MRLVTYCGDQGPRAGVLDPDGEAVFDVGRLLGEGSDSGVSLLEVIERWDDVAGRLAAPAGKPMPLSSLRLLAPLPRPPRNVMCVGKNYRDHSSEFARSGFDASSSRGDAAVPKRPVFFTKVPDSVIGPGDPIDPHCGLTRSLDYEAELAVIIGPGGRGITAEEAWHHVWGYTIVNDVTARDLQRDHKQWFLGKSLDTFCPMGPWAVTVSEVDATDMTVRCWVNGELRQKANTRDLIFGIPELIATLSAGITLRPGDIIATGTPAGVGIGFSPPRFLVPGDVVSMEISGLGKLTNPVEAGADVASPGQHRKETDAADQR
jgi:2-keto-4-pentenoate hydratase/2-oxohepta-3-ene-1,7-dioic acid hydratase in catechol pathway